VICVFYKYTPIRPDNEVSFFLFFLIFLLKTSVISSYCPSLEGKVEKDKGEIYNKNNIKWFLRDQRRGSKMFLEC